MSDYQTRLKQLESLFSEIRLWIKGEALPTQRQLADHAHSYIRAIAVDVAAERGAVPAPPNPVREVAEIQPPTPDATAGEKVEDAADISRKICEMPYSELHGRDPEEVVTELLLGWTDRIAADAHAKGRREGMEEAATMASSTSLYLNLNPEANRSMRKLSERIRAAKGEGGGGT